MGPFPLRPADRPGEDDELAIPWTALKRIGAVGGSLLLVVILVTTIMNHWHRRPTLAKAKEMAVAVATAAKKIVPPRAPPAPAAPSSDSDQAAGESSAADAMAAVGSPPAGPLPDDVAAAEVAAPLTPVAPMAPRALIAPQSSKAAAPPPVARLPEGLQAWHAQPTVRAPAPTTADAAESPLARIGWLVELLPYLGHEQLYQQFDFKQPLTQGKNLQLGAVLVPEFLNPLDDRQRWKGYPFGGIALTHFVGISGVEDSRNVVAAKLPRSDARAGVFGYDETARPEDISDGQSQTMMVAGAGALPNPWVFGGGATIRGAREPLFEKTSGLGTKGLPGGGSIVVMADGSVRHVNGKVDPRVFKAMSTTHGAETVDLEPAAAPFAWHDLRSQ